MPGSRPSIGAIPRGCGRQPVGVPGVGAGGLRRYWRFGQCIAGCSGDEQRRNSGANLWRHCHRFQQSGRIVITVLGGGDQLWAGSTKQDADSVFERTNSIGWTLRMRAGMQGSQEGMTLVEVLVALVILGVGLLGAAAFQLNALKYTDSARMTSQASFIAYDMLDRIRANAAADYTIAPPASGNLGRCPGSGPLLTSTPTLSVHSAPPRPAVSPSTSRCTPSRLTGTTHGPRIPPTRGAASS